MKTPDKCPNCEGRMQEGFILDVAVDRLVSHWVSGKPEASFWTGTSLSGRTRYPIQSFRCTGCGYLESYALAE